MRYLAQSQGPQTVGSTLSTILNNHDFNRGALFCARRFDPHHSRDTSKLRACTARATYAAMLFPPVIGSSSFSITCFRNHFRFWNLLVTQVTQLASDLPRYQSTLREKIKSLRGAAAGTETLERASAVLKELGKELDKPQDSKTPRSPTGSIKRAIGQAHTCRNPSSRPWRLPDVRYIYQSVDSSR